MSQDTIQSHCASDGLTSVESLRTYFSQFGEVLECTVMRDSATGRSRGFGFLTFKDPKTVNTVMVKEHYLDGKIVCIVAIPPMASSNDLMSYQIDPKRAIPRDEQEKTSKIFVGGVSQEATEQDFEQFFQQFGRVIDATLMMDKDTGRPRGFGFVTFEGEQAVEATLAQPLDILGKPIEVKKAQPRGHLHDEDNRPGKFGRRGHNDRFNRQQENQQGNNSNFAQEAQTSDAAQSTNNMTPQMMAQYWTRMQQWFAMMQQNMSNGMAPTQNMGGMMQNPQMMMQAMQNQGGNQNPPNAAVQNAMNPAMMQQLQMQQMQAMQQQQNAQSMQRMNSPMSGGPGNRPAFNAHEQQAFEQQKYEQQARRGPNSGSSSWDGMYEDVPQPNAGNQSNVTHGGHGNRGGRGGRGGGSQQPAGTPPANAPTGPRNAGRPGANYRGGGRGGHRGFHPYARN